MILLENKLHDEKIRSKLF